MQKKIVLLVFLFTTSTYGGQESTNQGSIRLTKSPLCFQSRCPTGSKTNNFIVDNKILILSSNRVTKFADFVAYVVDKKNMNGPKRKRRWRKDPSIPSTYTLSPIDYRGANRACGYDRGHQAPLASFSNNTYWEKTNYLSNITPQKAQLNQGPWVKLERAVRHLAKNSEKVYVITGPIYQKGKIMCPLPRQPSLQIPSAYFKVILQSSKAGVNYASFIMPQNTTRRTNMCNYSVSLQDVRKATGLKFLDDKAIRLNALSKKLGCRNL